MKAKTFLLMTGTCKSKPTNALVTHTDIKKYFPTYHQKTPFFNVFKTPERGYCSASQPMGFCNPADSKYLLVQL